MKQIALATLFGLAAGTVVAGQDAAGPLDLDARLLAHYQQQDRAGADRLLARTPNAARWDESSATQATAVFHSRAKGLTIRVERRAGSDARKRLRVVLPPGTWAAPRVDPDGPAPQDLLLIRPFSFSLAPGQQRVEATIPVACAAFARQGPEAGVRYELRRAKPGSNLDRIALAICARKELPQELDSGLALAIWIAHEDLGYRRLAGSTLGFRTFRTPRLRVGTEHGPAAAALLRAAGLDLDGFDFYRVGGAKARGPETPPSSEPRAKPAGKTGEPTPVAPTIRP